MFLASLLLASTAVAGAQAGRSPAAKPEAFPRADQEPPAWGLYQIYWDPARYRDMLVRETARLASQPHYVMFYRDLGRPFPAAAVQAIRVLGARPIISLELWHWHGRRTRRCLPEIVTGRYDGFFEQWADQARREGRPLLLRFGFEFNGE